MPLKMIKHDRDAQLSQRMSDLIDIITLDLNQRIQHNQSLSAPKTFFCVSRLPSISIKNYLKRLATYLDLEEPCFVFMLIYLDRIFQNNPSDFLHPLNCHRLLTALLLIAHKFVEDNPFINKAFSDFSGMTILDLNQLELDVVNQLTFDLYVSTRDYLKITKFLNTLARTEEKKSATRYLILFTEEDEALLQALALNPLYIAPNALEPIDTYETADKDPSESSSAASSSSASTITAAPLPTHRANQLPPLHPQALPQQANTIASSLNYHLFGPTFINQTGADAVEEIKTAKAEPPHHMAP